MERKEVHLNLAALNEYETIHTRIGNLKNVLYHLLGVEKFNAFITGKPSQIDALAVAAAAEKDFMNISNVYGQDSPQARSSKLKLDRSIKDFERKTNIPWPIK